MRQLAKPAMRNARLKGTRRAGYLLPRVAQSSVLVQDRYCRRPRATPSSRLRQNGGSVHAASFRVLPPKSSVTATWSSFSGIRSILMFGNWRVARLNTLRYAGRQKYTVNSSFRCDKHKHWRGVWRQNARNGARNGGLRGRLRESCGMPPNYPNRRRPCRTPRPSTCLRVALPSRFARW